MVRILPRRIRRRSFADATEDIRRLEQEDYQRSKVDKGTQILLSLKFQEMMHNGSRMPGFDEVGFRAYSQSNEDGILLYIFTLIGTTNKHVVDIGSAGIEGSSTANLIINHGWIGLLIDGNEEMLGAARHFYTNCPDTRIFPPVTLHAWVTAENINSLISEHGFAGEIDLLSIDIDGMDYWVWKAIECINPRVVVVEYQNFFGPDKALTVPYKPDFKLPWDDGDIFDLHYCGASLPAFVKLARQKGYRLVGCNRYEYNAFFIRHGVGGIYLPEVPTESCFKHLTSKLGMAKRYPTVKDMDWLEV